MTDREILLSEVKRRYMSWYNRGNDMVANGSDPLWSYSDFGETKEHCIVRNDIPLLLALLGDKDFEGELEDD